MDWDKAYELDEDNTKVSGRPHHETEKER